MNVEGRATSVCVNLRLLLYRHNVNSGSTSCDVGGVRCINNLRGLFNNWVVILYPLVI